MKNTEPRIWITTLVTAGWILLALRFASKENWSFVALSVIAALAYGYRLYLLMQKRPK